MRPLEDRVILKIEKKQEEEKTSSGFVLVGSKEKENPEAIVVAVGEGHLFSNGTRMEMPVKVGDKVIYTPMATQSMTVDGEEYLVTYTKDIIAIIEEDNA